MAMFDSYSINRFRSFYEYNHRFTYLHTLPLIAEIELTNICNLKCGFCNREAVAKSGFGMMNYPYFIALAGVLQKQMIHPRLFLHGESTLNPDLIKMVKFLNDTYRHYQGKDYVRSIGFATNGTLLDAKLFRQLVDAGLDNIEFSFEGTDKETYESLRVGAKFETVKQNILDACKINFELGCPVNIGINIIDCKQTRPKLESFIKEWKDIPGLNRIDIGTLGDWAGSLNVDAYKTGDEPKYLPICAAPWFTCTVLWDGSIVPCCKLRDVVMGNVFWPQSTPQPWLEKQLFSWKNYGGTTGLGGTWNGKKYQQFRRDMLKGREKHPYCSKCKSNLFSEGSPYLTMPNRFYPFTKSLLSQISAYRKVSGNKKYVPLKEKQKNG